MSKEAGADVVWSQQRQRLQITHELCRLDRLLCVQLLRLTLEVCSHSYCRHCLCPSQTSFQGVQELHILAVVRVGLPATSHAKHCGPGEFLAASKRETHSQAHTHLTHITHLTHNHTQRHTHTHATQTHTHRQHKNTTQQHNTTTQHTTQHDTTVYDTTRVTRHDTTQHVCTHAP